VLGGIAYLAAAKVVRSQELERAIAIVSRRLRLAR
jgi:hypothetical protein